MWFLNGGKLIECMHSPPLARAPQHGCASVSHSSFASGVCTEVQALVRVPGYLDTQPGWETAGLMSHEQTDQIV